MNNRPGIAGVERDRRECIDGGCSTQWTGSLTVDLGRVRSLNGFGAAASGPMARPPVAPAAC